MTTYIKNGSAVLADPSNLFVYETSIYVCHKNIVCLIKKTYYSAPREIQGVVGSFYKTSNIQICSELYSAPESWLIENKFEMYSKPKKITKSKTKKIK